MYIFISLLLLKNHNSFVNTFLFSSLYKIHIYTKFVHLEYVNINVIIIKLCKMYILI